LDIIDTYLVYKFIKALVTPWTSTDAYKLGIIDSNGNMLIPSGSLTKEQHAALTPFTNLVFKLKRILNNVPFVGAKLASYAAALWLLKEAHRSDSYALDESDISDFLVLRATHLSAEVAELKAFNEDHPSFELTTILMEDGGGGGGGGGAGGVAANNVGGGNIAGANGDPPGPSAVQAPLYRRKANKKNPIKKE
jgi:hypothetical protein